MLSTLKHTQNQKKSLKTEKNITRASNQKAVFVLFLTHAVTAKTKYGEGFSSQLCIADGACGGRMEEDVCGLAPSKVKSNGVPSSM